MKNTKKILKFIIFLLCFVVTPFIYGRYTTKYDKTITLNVSKPVYTVTFHSNYNDTTVLQNFIYGTSQALRTNTFTRATYLFVEWNTEPDGSGIVYTDHQVVNKLTPYNNDNIDLYAQWRRELTFTVTGNPTNWQNTDATLTIVPDYADTYQYSFDGGTTWQNTPSHTFSSNQTVNMKIKTQDGFVSSLVTENITKIDKVAPTITLANSLEYNADHTIKSVTTLIATLGENTSITTGLTVSDDLSGVASGYPVCSRNGTNITSTNVFTNVGRYAITCTVQDNAGNIATEDREVLVRWPLAGKYVVKRQNVVGEGLIYTNSVAGLIKDNADTGLDSSLPFSSKYFYTGKTVDNYVTFAGKTYNIINVAVNDDVKLISELSGNSIRWNSTGQPYNFYETRVYSNWKNKFTPERYMYNSDDSKYYQFTETEWSHVDTATFYAGAVERPLIDADTIANTINQERTVQPNGGGSPGFESKVSWPNVSDFLKACNYMDLVFSIRSSQLHQPTFRDYSWLASTKEQWTVNAKLNSNDFWVLDSGITTGNQILSNGYNVSAQYRPVFYLKNDTILSGLGTSSEPYNVEEDWAWFDSYQVVQ